MLGINHLAFRTPDPARLRAFYLDLLGDEALRGDHAPIRAGSTVLVFFRSNHPVGADEIGFDVDAQGFDEIVARARRLDVVERGPVEHNERSRGLYLRDPDGRQLEITHVDHGVFWSAE